MQYDALESILEILNDPHLDVEMRVPISTKAARDWHDAYPLDPITAYDEDIYSELP